METFVLNLIVGPLMVVIAFIFRYFPPKEINSWYGYRTMRSMRSPEAWKAANEHSSRLMLKSALAALVVQGVCYFLLRLEYALMIPMIFFIVGVIVSIFMTEEYLKKNFDM